MAKGVDNSGPAAPPWAGRTGAAAAPAATAAKVEVVVKAVGASPPLSPSSRSLVAEVSYEVVPETEAALAAADLKKKKFDALGVALDRVVDSFGSAGTPEEDDRRFALINGLIWERSIDDGPGSWNTFAFRYPKALEARIAACVVRQQLNGKLGEIMCKPAGEQLRLCLVKDRVLGPYDRIMREGEHEHVAASKPYRPEEHRDLGPRDTILRPILLQPGTLAGVFSFYIYGKFDSSKAFEMTITFDRR